VSLRLRPATADDAERLLAWRNDPVTRAASRSTAEVALDEHRGWLERVLADPERHLLIGEAEGRAVGQARFDALDDGAYEISVTVAPEVRGQGLGTALIAAATGWLRETAPGAAVLAAVRPENAASLAAFRAAGYEPSERDAPAGLVWLQA
jgi:RimJ/RimL family protein N-acetyltransferase